MPLHSHLKADCERAIVAATVDALLAAGYTVTVDNGGEEPELDSSTDKERILGAMFATDQEKLIVKKPDEAGWVLFVYGNDGWDVRSDYTVNLEGVLKSVSALEDEWEAKLS